MKKNIMCYVCEEIRLYTYILRERRRETELVYVCHDDDDHMIMMVAMK